MRFINSYSYNSWWQRCSQRLLSRLHFSATAVASGELKSRQKWQLHNSLSVTCHSLADTSMGTKYCSISTSLLQTRDLVSRQGHQGRNNKYYAAANSAIASTFSFDVVVEHKWESLITFSFQCWQRVTKTCVSFPSWIASSCSVSTLCIPFQQHGGHTQVTASSKLCKVTECYAVIFNQLEST